MQPFSFLGYNEVMRTKLLIMAGLLGFSLASAEVYYYPPAPNAFPDDTVKSVSSDDEITRRVEEKLKSALWSKKIENANFQVSSGVVSLYGEVKTNSDRDRIANEIRKLTGVRGIDNQITVQGRY